MPRERLFKTNTHSEHTERNGNLHGQVLKVSLTWFWGSKTLPGAREGSVSLPPQASRAACATYFSLLWYL